MDVAQALTLLGLPEDYSMVPPETAGVYFVLCGDRVKVGRSRNVRKRLDSYTSHVPHVLTLLAVWENPEDEAVFHQRLASVRRYGEWFEVSTEVGDVVRAVLEKRVGELPKTKPRRLNPTRWASPPFVDRFAVQLKKNPAQAYKYLVAWLQRRGFSLARGLDDLRIGWDVAGVKGAMDEDLADKALRDPRCGSYNERLKWCLHFSKGGAAFVRKFYGMVAPKTVDEFCARWTHMIGTPPKPEFLDYLQRRYIDMRGPLPTAPRAKCLKCGKYRGALSNQLSLPFPDVEPAKVAAPVRIAREWRKNIRLSPTDGAVVFGGLKAS
jgi:Meiotically up-regulated gene 113